MKRRTAIGLVAALTGGVLASAGALAYGHGMHRGRHEMMQRFVSSAIDDALDRANVTAEQRQRVHAARDRVFAAFKEHRREREGRAESVLALFEADQVDAQAVTAVRDRIEAEHRQLSDVITQALVEIHDVLTPAQRKALADHVRERHRRFH
jgi:Spy/CpxP family protein refolding chaperone